MVYESFGEIETGQPIVAEDYLDHPEGLRLKLEARGALDFIPYASGLFPASALSPEMAEATGMGLAWLRDNAHIVNALYQAGKTELALPAAQAILTILHSNRALLDGIVDGSLDPHDPHQRLPVRVNGETLERGTEPEPRVQNDSVGYALWLTSSFMQNGILRPSARDLETLAQTVRYFSTIQYWMDADDGHWEEDRQIHASSVGAVIAGLRETQALFGRLKYDQDIDFNALIAAGYETLRSLRVRGLTRVRDMYGLANSLVKPSAIEIPADIPESILAQSFLDSFSVDERRHDAAMLFLVEPLHVLGGPDSQAVVQDITRYLLREHGVARYEGDTYWGPRFKDIMSVTKRTTAAAGRTEARNMKAAGIALTRTEAQCTLFDPLFSVHAGRLFKATHAPEERAMQLEFLNRSLSELVPTPDGRLLMPEARYLELTTDQMGRKHSTWLPNDHMPLLWSQANLLLALHMFEATTTVK